METLQQIFESDPELFNLMIPNVQLLLEQMQMMYPPGSVFTDEMIEDMVNKIVSELPVSGDEEIESDPEAVPAVRGMGGGFRGGFGGRRGP